MDNTHMQRTRGRGELRRVRVLRARQARQDRSNGDGKLTLAGLKTGGSNW